MRGSLEPGAREPSEEWLRQMALTEEHIRRDKAETNARDDDQDPATMTAPQPMALDEARNTADDADADYDKVPSDVQDEGWASHMRSHWRKVEKQSQTDNDHNERLSSRREPSNDPEGTKHGDNDDDWEDADVRRTHQESKRMAESLSEMRQRDADRLEPSDLRREKPAPKKESLRDQVERMRDEEEARVKRMIMNKINRGTDDDWEEK